MSSDGFNISHSSPTAVLYDEGQGRTIEFKCRAGDDMTAISAPATDAWSYHTPPWAHEKRQIILDRLRSSGLIVYETSQLLLSVLSPDRAYRIETQWQPDERAPAWETVQITKVAGNRMILRLPLYSFADNIEFAEGGIVGIALQGRYGERHRLQLDVGGETFRLDDDPAEQPLTQLPDRLATKHPAPTLSYSSIPPARKPPWLGDLASAIISPLFVVGGVWMCIDGKTMKDRLIGGFGVFFFGAIAAVSIRTLLRRWRRL